MKTLHIQVCIFKRKQRNKEYEVGIMLNDDKHIIDSNGKRVENVWTYMLTPDRGCFIVEK